MVLTRGVNVLSVAVITLLHQSLVGCLTILETPDKGCVVVTDQGKLNLTDLASKGNQPKFSDGIAEPGGAYLYTKWNPCKEITPTGCDSPGELFNVESLSGQSECQTVGQKKDASFHTADDKIFLSFPGGYKITFDCTTGPDTFKIADQQGIDMTFSGKSACFTTDSGKSGLSTGSILIIIFVVVVFVYFVGGFVLMKIFRKANGLDSIPNSEFWRSLPINIKYGFLFVFRCGRSKEYDNV